MYQFGSVKVFAETIEESAMAQIEAIAESPIGGEGAHIRIMPDAHAGKGCVIGTSLYVDGRAIPSVVGVDIGCGVVAYHLAESLGYEDYLALDEFCQAHIVSGCHVHSAPISLEGRALVESLYCLKGIKSLEYLDCSMGSLGGGNHFIELDVAEDGSHWLILHCGSRHLGVEVASYYQAIADEGLGYLEGVELEHYLHDMGLCQEWAELNRSILAESILQGMGWHVVGVVKSIHNYIDLEHMILRKGAISAQLGESCIIPLNMRDGSLLCVGKGCEDWNYSAPHGAGRLMSRGQASRSIALEDFEESMASIVSSSICSSTLDESPFAYKDYHEIMEIVQESVEIVERIVPVFNYKAID